MKNIFFIFFLLCATLNAKSFWGGIVDIELTGGSRDCSDEFRSGHYGREIYEDPGFDDFYYQSKESSSRNYNDGRKAYRNNTVVCEDDYYYYIDDIDYDWYDEYYYRRYGKYRKNPPKKCKRAPDYEVDYYKNVTTKDGEQYKIIYYKSSR